MRSLTVLLLSVVLGSLGCVQTGTWQGTVQRCSEGRSEQSALLILDAPLGPNPVGWFGAGAPASDETWTLSQVRDSELLGNHLTFTVKFDREYPEVWKLDLVNTGPDELKGRADIEVTVPEFKSTQASRCSITLKLQS